MKSLIILGAGSFGYTVKDIAEQSGSYSKILFLDDYLVNSDVIGKCFEWSNHIGEEIDFFPAFGDNRLRLSWYENLTAKGHIIPSFIHSSSYVSPYTSIGQGVVIMPGAIINTNTSIGEACIINCGAIIDHNCVIEKGCHIGIGTIIKGFNKIEQLTVIKAGAILERGN